MPPRYIVVFILSSPLSSRRALPWVLPFSRHLQNVFLSILMPLTIGTSFCIFLCTFCSCPRMLISTYLSLATWLNLPISRFPSCIASSRSSHSSLLLPFIFCAGATCGCAYTIIFLRALPIRSYSFLYRIALKGNDLSLMMSS